MKDASKPCTKPPARAATQVAQGSPFALTDEEFARIRELAYERWGLDISERKRTLVENRLQRLFDALSTNLMSFFRDPQHFEVLVEETLAPLADKRRQPGRRLRLGPAGWTTGCEPYSLAMSAFDTLPKERAGQVTILATDFANSVLETCRLGRYPNQLVEPLDPATFTRHFVEDASDQAGAAQVARTSSNSCASTSSTSSTTGRSPSPSTRSPAATS